MNGRKWRRGSFNNVGLDLIVSYVIMYFIMIGNELHVFLSCNIVMDWL